MDAGSVLLRPLVYDDLPQLRMWRNDPEVTRHLARLSMTSAQIHSWYGSLEFGAGDRAYAIVVGAAFVGYAVLTDADPINKKCEAGIFIGDRTQWGRGIGAIVARELVRIAFVEVGMHRVLAVASERNLRSIRCFSKAGFREEGRLRHANLRYGQYIDVVLLSLLEPEWREALAPASSSLRGAAGPGEPTSTTRNRPACRLHAEPEHPDSWRSLPGRARAALEQVVAIVAPVPRRMRHRPVPGRL